MDCKLNFKEQVYNITASTNQRAFLIKSVSYLRILLRLLTLLKYLYAHWSNIAHL